MSSFNRFNQSWRRSLGYVGLLGAATAAIVNVNARYNDRIQGHDAFSNHTRQQQQRRMITGMHEPFITTDPNELELFQKHFSQFSYLWHQDINVLKQKYALQTPVKIRPLKECPIQPDPSVHYHNTLAVGGPPAIISAASIVKAEKNLTYINDQRRIPIAYGSAWHLEEDAETEAPTSYKPSKFLFSQISRAVLGNVRYSTIQQTGHFPWRTLDWIGWMQHPSHWFAGFKILFAFQLFTMLDDRAATISKVATQCVANEKFFEELDRELNGTLLLDERGSVMVARTDNEVKDLQAIKTALEAEGRTLKTISQDDLLNQYGFLPKGLMYADKTHDRVLLPNFMLTVSKFIQDKGGNVVDGTLTTIYVDKQRSGGIAEYTTPDGKRHHIPFARIILSLGNQPILDQNNKPLFDVVAARGVSALTHVYVPSNYRLPSLLICGETNNATKLSEKPIQVEGPDGKNYDLYLVRLTAGACITPNVSDESAANYDGTIAVGLISAVRDVLGESIRVEPLFIHGCNRQVSRYGQTSWMEPFPGVHIQYGAGGGGLTRAPDFVAR